MVINAFKAAADKMSRIFLSIVCYAINLGLTAAKLPEANMTTTEIIAYLGYPFEIHHVTTDDGYILELHRIPQGRNETEDTKKSDKPVVFLQHGFIGSSAVWVTNGADKSAGCMFADAGFDVWMGNARGNTYSRQHERYSVETRRFWSFTWDEISNFDLPAMIDYTLNVTSAPNLYYVGYSEGTLIMFAKLSTDPTFATKIRKFFALGPIGKIAHIRGLIKTAAMKFMRPLKIMVRVIPEFMPNDSLFKSMSKATCSIQPMMEHCENLMFQMTGPDTSQLDEARIPIYMTHLPAGTSTANLLHWAQMVKSKQLQMYDYGSREANIDNYGQPIPPPYNLSRVNAPVYLYWSAQDWLADKRDVEESLIAVIPKEFIIENNELVHFNHFDFIWGMNAPEKIYRPIIKIIEEDHDGIRLELIVGD
ncbi:hypothetical protein AB6A40_001509 [Gnathostoma spinigerum]|uniref:Lipase n=1 Tax=Gnathostoma spinigerum TaxID=75299 RepID=A0ABD6E5C3_9BILA